MVIDMKDNICFIPARIRDARIARGYSLGDLSDLIGISSQAISQYELGTSKPSMEIMMRIANTLDFPLSFFKKKKSYNGDFSDSAVYFRSMKSSTKKMKDAYKVRIEWTDEIFRFLCKYIDFPSVDMPDFAELITDDLDNDRIELIAEKVRNYWGLDNKVYFNVVEVLQEKGFVIAKIDLNNKKIDAFSQWYRNTPYIILGTTSTSAVRLRFDLAHELGHLILHRNITQEAISETNILQRIEQEANYFAGAFLLPRKSFSNEVFSSSLEHFTMLKKRWRVSIQAMIMRAQALNILTDNQARYLFVQINKGGYRTKEPLDDVIDIEEIYLFKQAFELLLDNNVLDAEQILEEISLKKEEVDSICSIPSSLLEMKKSGTVLKLRKS